LDEISLLLPLPSWPYQFQPQAHTVPSLRKAKLKVSPAAKATTELVWADTFTGKIIPPHVTVNKKRTPKHPIFDLTKTFILILLSYPTYANLLNLHLKDPINNIKMLLPLKGSKVNIKFGAFSGAYYIEIIGNFLSRQ